MSAWYECTGPTAQEVRSDVYKYITSSNIEIIKYKKEKDKIIQEALHKIIPDNRNDFGSWRGYATFGVMKQVAGEVIKEVERSCKECGGEDEVNEKPSIM
tara:strand:+ start:143 stop:442 length:300 start_codon:yes stop_codon:yes gene_type:complete